LFAITAQYVKHEKDGSKLVDMYLASINIVHQTGEALWEAMKLVIKEFQLNLDNCYGLSTDNA
jgi:hypothetical protein